MRQWVLVITALAAAMPQAASALGLGEIRLLSALHEPLQAEIAVNAARPEELDRITLVIANSETFTRLGVDRPIFLAQLRFKPVVKANGNTVMQVTSEDPVREPFLDFIVQADWPGGRLLREYTVLVDPPSTQRKRTAALAFDAPEISVSSAEGSPTSNGVQVNLASEYGPTQSGDTLWKIAQRVGSGARVGQVMDALVLANPDAFIGGNPNRLKTGQVLRVPDAEGIRVLASAQGEVNFQAATGRVAAAAAPIARSNPQDQVRIAGATPATATVGASSEEAAVLNKQNTELSAKVADLEDQLRKLQTLRNDDLARLQQGTTPPVAKLPEVTPPIATTPEVTPPIATTPEVTPPIATTPEVTPPIATTPEVTPPIATTPEVTPPIATTPDVTVAQVTVPDGATPTDTPPKAAAGMSRFVWLGVGVLGLAGFVGGLLFFLRRRSENTTPDFTRQGRGSLDDDADDDNAGADFIEGAADPGKHEDTSFLSDFTPSDIEAIQNEASAVVDPLSEADVYIAYQRYQQVEDLLKLAIADAPERVELHLKLLEVYAATKNAAGFEKTAAQVAHISGKSGAAWEKVVGMGKGWLPPYSKVLGGTGSPPTGDSDMVMLTQPTAAPLAASTPAAKPPAAKPAPEPEVEPDSGLNFDFDLDTWLKEQQAGTQAVTPIEEEPHSSGLDFTLTAPSAKPAATPPAATPVVAAAATPITAPEDDLTPHLVDEVELALPDLDVSSEMDLFDDVGTKLELARAYVEMGDADGARSLLDEVIAEGSGAQKQEAREMLAQLK